MEPPIEVADLVGSGLLISNVKLSIDSQQISGASYTITNHSGKTLLSYVSTLDYYWDVASKTPVRESHSEDGWFLTGSLLGPGQQDRAELMTSLYPHQPAHLLRVTVNLQYAEFTDGTIWGRLDRATAQMLSTVRQEKLNIEKQYAALLRAGLSENQIAAKIDADLRNSTISASTRTGLLQLQIGLTNLGAKGLSQKIMAAPVSVPALLITQRN